MQRREFARQTRQTRQTRQNIQIWRSTEISSNFNKKHGWLMPKIGSKSSFYFAFLYNLHLAFWTAKVKGKVPDICRAKKDCFKNITIFHLLQTLNSNYNKQAEWSSNPYFSWLISFNSINNQKLATNFCTSSISRHFSCSTFLANRDKV